MNPPAIKCPACRAVGATTTDVASTCHRCSGIGWLRTVAQRPARVSQ